MAAQICETCKRKNDWTCYCAPNSCCTEYEELIELTEEEKMEDAMIRAVINGGIKGRDLIDLWQERGLIAVYHLGMKHMYEYLKGDSNG